MTRVYIVDDQPMVRAGISMLLAGEDDLEVLGEAGSADDAIAEIRRLRPDVVLMDVRMPGTDGVSATRELVSDVGASPDQIIRVLIMTTFDDEDVVVRALQAGASGYLLKHASPTEIADAVRRVAAGDTWLDARAAARIVERLRPRTAVSRDISALLTPREQDVLRMVAAGLTNQEIRVRLNLSEATVKTHVARILLKTGSRDRAGAVALAYRSGFAQPDDPIPGTD
ncbi:response regulator transcription factor [Brachybacterium huguangmaarense]|uniref:Response regulator transcription factor n=1 Tax=Brachybacterium huguangmaarense TaxID=1652028 RepID=A0ABY6G2T2_9MICO|nr:response regulator transcription factor [Brachybacterium huguangmaarense]UYG17523.1 response regulator transcription factor [Brachybacterium huguangmaarense]